LGVLIVASTKLRDAKKFTILSEWPYTEIYKFLILAVQLALLLLVLRQFQIESNAFLRVAVLAFGGFAIHYFLPDRFRLLFFLFLSLCSIAIVFGPAAGAWLIGIGLVLIGICHLPLPFYGRVLSLLLVGTGLAVLRVDWIQAPWSQAIWPILGSMFMFRLMVYLYDLKHDNFLYAAKCLFSALPDRGLQDLQTKLL
jgi:hypothetical protein